MGDLASYGNHGDKVKKGVDKPRDQVSGARARSGYANARVASGASIAIGGKDLTLLMVKKVVGERGRVGEGLVDLHGGTAGVGEDLGDALMLEGFDEDIRALAGLIR